MSAARESTLVEPSSIPRGPFTRAPRELGEFAISGGDPTEAVRDWLRAVLEESGVELAAYDERILSWLARCVDWPSVQVLAGWITRAAAGSPPPSPPSPPRIVPCPGCHAVTRVRDRWCAFCDAHVGGPGDEL